MDNKVPCLWGRPSNTLKMGIVGLPNVGKSTLFNIISHMNVPAKTTHFAQKSLTTQKLRC